MNPASTTVSPASLPPVIPLVRYLPTRRAFDLRSFDPARVRAAADLPPYLVLGPLDETSFAIGPDGWSATYRGSDAGTELGLAYGLPHGLYSLHQSWRGIAGGCAGADARLPLDRVVGQYLRFPDAWDKAAPAALAAVCHVHCVLPPATLPTFVGVPDGALRTIAIPVAVGELRAVRAQLAAVAAALPGYPFAAAARLVTQTVHYRNRSAAATLHDRSTAQTGIAPLGTLQPALAPDGRTTRALRRCVYLVCVTVPFAGLADLVAKLSGPTGPIRGATDRAPASEWTPLVLPPGIEHLPGTVDVWLPRQSSGCSWRFADPFGRAPEALAAGEAWSAARAETLLQAAEAAAEGEEEPEGVTLDEFLDEGSDRENACRDLLRSLPTLIGHREFLAALVKVLRPDGDEVIAAIRNGDPLPEERWDELVEPVNEIYDQLAGSVVTLSWDSDTPMGSSGASWIRELAGVYMFFSSDWPAAGPFDSLDEALDGNDSFSMPTHHAEIQGILPDEKLLEIARGVATEDWPVLINGSEYGWVDGELRPKGEEA